MLTISPSLLTVDQLSEITEGTLFVVNQSIQSIMSNITELSSDILKKWNQYHQDIPRPTNIFDSNITNILR
jgi:hypothetical protein